MLATQWASLTVARVPHLHGNLAVEGVHVLLVGQATVDPILLLVLVGVVVKEPSLFSSVGKVALVFVHVQVQLLVGILLVRKSLERLIIDIIITIIAVNFIVAVIIDIVAISIGVEVIQIHLIVRVVIASLILLTLLIHPLRPGAEHLVRKDVVLAQERQAGRIRDLVVAGVRSLDGVVARSGASGPVLGLVLLVGIDDALLLLGRELVPHGEDGRLGLGQASRGGDDITPPLVLAFAVAVAVAVAAYLVVIPVVVEHTALRAHAAALLADAVVLVGASVVVLGRLAHVRVEEALVLVVPGNHPHRVGVVSPVERLLLLVRQRVPAGLERVGGRPVALLEGHVAAPAEDAAGPFLPPRRQRGQLVVGHVHLVLGGHEVPAVPPVDVAPEHHEEQVVLQADGAPHRLLDHQLVRARQVHVALAPALEVAETQVPGGHAEVVLPLLPVLGGVVVLAAVPHAHLHHLQEGVGGVGPAEQPPQRGQALALAEERLDEGGALGPEGRLVEAQLQLDEEHLRVVQVPRPPQVLVADEGPPQVVGADVHEQPDLLEGLVGRPRQPVAVARQARQDVAHAPLALDDHGEVLEAGHHADGLVAGLGPVGCRPSRPGEVVHEGSWCGPRGARGVLDGVLAVELPEEDLEGGGRHVLSPGEDGGLPVLLDEAVEGLADAEEVDDVSGAHVLADLGGQPDVGADGLEKVESRLAEQLGVQGKHVDGVVDLLGATFGAVDVHLSRVVQVDLRTSALSLACSHCLLHRGLVELGLACRHDGLAIRPLLRLLSLDDLAQRLSLLVDAHGSVGDAT
ncbi:hypothetical protein VM1G_11731 [Cytospora mali]|uniref:Uncharacterized protein n=1 Tax=Cytospora mali TaxID=578113 RepID=A0A194W6J4_CYTMA|nr:hypothetical protein VM1G_11731 [Valsa mali]